MARRLTDSRKWFDPWYRQLQPTYKLLWIYILDTCDHAGIWKKDFDMASYCIGKKVNEETALACLNGRVVPVGDEKWFIEKYITFQYGVLNPACKPHLSAINILKKEGVYEGLLSTLQRTKDKNKDKVKDKDKDKEANYGEFVFLKDKDFEKLREEMGEATLNNYIERVNDYVGSSGKKYKSYYHAIRSFWSRDGKKKVKERKIIYD